jgi:hypothetical protein
MSKEGSHGEGPPQSPDYVVGYGRPPVQHRFQLGQSGNKKGRPKRRPPTAREIEDKLLFDRRSVRSGDKLLNMTTFELLLRKQIELASKGNMRALRDILAAVKKEEGRLSKYPSNLKEMSDKDLGLLRDRIIEYQRAHGGLRSG